MRVSVATHSGQHLLLSLFFLPLNINHWNRCELVFYCGFSLIFLVKNYTEHPFMCLSVSHISYLMRYLFKPFVCVFAGSQNMRSHPWQGHEKEAWQARQIRTSGISKSCPGAHLKDGLCLSDACYVRLLPNFCDTGRRPSPISLQTEAT